MLLRQVEPGDVEAYVRMRCDPEMMAELGAPVPRLVLPEFQGGGPATLVGEREVEFAGRRIQSNHWRLDPQTELA